jgi:hypothetical protein
LFCKEVAVIGCLWLKGWDFSFGYAVFTNYFRGDTIPGFLFNWINGNRKSISNTDIQGQLQGTMGSSLSNTGIGILLFYTSLVMDPKKIR